MFSNGRNGSALNWTPAGERSRHWIVTFHLMTCGAIADFIWRSSLLVASMYFVVRISIAGVDEQEGKRIVIIEPSSEAA
jgi:hypothetical protein